MAPAVSPPKILVTSVFGYQNRGDWQLAISLFRLLDQTFPGCRIDALCRDPGTQTAWFPNVTFHQLLGVSFRPPGLLRLLESALGFALNLLSTAFAIVTGVGITRLSRLYREADIVIAAPGGYLADENVSILMHAAHIWLGVLAGKPVLLAPQSIGPLKTRLWRNLMRRLLARVEAACARDETSSELVKELGSESRLRIVPDMAFQDDSLDLDAAQSELTRLGLWSRPFIAMTVSQGGMPYYAGPPPVEGALECLARLCGRLEQDGFQILVWTHVESDAGIAGDETAMRKFAAMAPRNVVISTSRYPPSLVRGILRYSSAVVSHRLHPCIFAAQAGRPAVALATSPKFLGVLSMLHLESAVLDGSMPDPDALYQRLQELMKQPHLFQEAPAKARALGERSHLLFSELLLECWNRSAHRLGRP